MQPSAFFDLQGASAIAGAVGMALLNRERTGEGGTVDVSLLNVGMWTMGPDIAAAPLVGDLPPPSRHEMMNPLTNWYPTKDGRWLYLVLLQSDRYWAELCAFTEALDLLLDERFADAAARYEHRAECVDALTEVFRRRTLAEWRTVLEGFSGVWAPVQSAREVHEHPQPGENGYLQQLSNAAGREFTLVALPMQFDGEPVEARGPAPRLGADTDDVLAGLGYGEEEIKQLREQDVLG